MRIVIHAFSLFGAGHLQRARAIADALSAHEIVWLGHRPPGASGDLAPYPVIVCHDPPTAADEVMCRAAGHMAATWLQDYRPDLVITEYFPFGNPRLAEGLIPVLQTARQNGIPVVASIRDILGKDHEDSGWATQAVTFLNSWYTALLWHGDASLLPFDFPLLGQLTIPVLPTGYVRFGQASPRQPEARHWVASCGSGNRGGLWFGMIALAAQRRLAAQGWRLTLVCGEPTSKRLQAEPGIVPDGARLLAWTDDFPGLLATAAVSVSQCGYNTCLEVLDSRSPAVFIPFVEPRDIEQRLRADVLAQYPGYRTLSATAENLADRLAEAIASLTDVSPEPPTITFDGATTSAQLLERLSAPSQNR